MKQTSRGEARDGGRTTTNSAGVTAFLQLRDMTYQIPLIYIYSPLLTIASSDLSGQQLTDDTDIVNRTRAQGTRKTRQCFISS